MSRAWDILLECLKPRTEGGFESVFTYQALGCLKMPEFGEKAKNVFLEAAGINNDKAALTALKILHRVFESSSGEERKNSLKTIQDFYWQMFYTQECGCEFIPVMEESKKFIIQAVVWEWHMLNSHTPKEPSEYGRELLRFVAECYRDLPKNIDKELLERIGQYGFKQKTRHVFEKNQEMIEKILRDAVKNVPPENLKLWLKEKWMPDGLVKLLGIAWARNGGYIELTK